MRYFGGKTRICDKISNIINKIKKPDQLFISPFVGGGWVENLVTGTKHCYDKHNYLISMYQELQKGWLPPKELTLEEYNYIKSHKDEKPYLTGFVGFGCSFAGKWFGGYAKDKTDRNYCLNAYNSIMVKMEGFKDTKFECSDYSSLKPTNAVIYCDPPYKGTCQYASQVVGNFDHDKFWQDMREWSKNNIVLVSEYIAPEDIECVWSQNVKLNIRDKNNQQQDRVEKLFGLGVTKNEINETGGLFEI